MAWSWVYAYYLLLVCLEAGDASVAWKAHLPNSTSRLRRGQQLLVDPRTNAPIFILLLGCTMEKLLNTRRAIVALSEWLGDAPTVTLVEPFICDGQAGGIPHYRPANPRYTCPTHLRPFSMYFDTDNVTTPPMIPYEDFSAYIKEHTPTVTSLHHRMSGPLCVTPVSDAPTNVLRRGGILFHSGREDLKTHMDTNLSFAFHRLPNHAPPRRRQCGVATHTVRTRHMSCAETCALNPDCDFSQEGCRLFQKGQHTPGSRCLSATPKGSRNVPIKSGPVVIALEVWHKAWWPSLWRRFPPAEHWRAPAVKWAEDNLPPDYIALYIRHGNFVRGQTSAKKTFAFWARMETIIQGWTTASKDRRFFLTTDYPYQPEVSSTSKWHQRNASWYDNVTASQFRRLEERFQVVRFPSEDLPVDLLFLLELFVLCNAEKVVGTFATAIKVMQLMECPERPRNGFIRL